MREILFRGRRRDNREWVFGCYYKQSEFYGEKAEGIMIITSCESLCYDQALEYYAVSEETVGQFTGLTDHNGVKIFEGDIVKHYCEHRADGIISIGVVFWDEKRCMFLRTSTAGNETPQIWEGCEYEVIGNIHDNPELLEG